MLLLASTISEMHLIMSTANKQNLDSALLVYNLSEPLPTEISRCCCCFFFFSTVIVTFKYF